MLQDESAIHFIFEQMHQRSSIDERFIDMFSLPILTLSASFGIVHVNTAAKKLFTVDDEAFEYHDYIALCKKFSSHSNEVDMTKHIINKMQSQEQTSLNQLIINEKSDHIYEVSWQIQKNKKTSLRGISYILVGEILKTFSNKQKQEEGLRNFSSIVEQNNSFKSSQLDYLSELIQGLPDCAYIKDRESRYIAGNDYLLNTVFDSLTPNELKGKNDIYLNDIIGKRWPKGFYQKIRQDDLSVMESKDALTNVIEPPFLLSDGKLVIQSATKVPILDARGNCIGLSGISIDITEQFNPITLFSYYKNFYHNDKEAKNAFLLHVYRLPHDDAKFSLTVRELEICLYLSLGMTVKELASKLGISARTAEGYITSIREKFGFLSKAQIAQFFNRQLFKTHEGELVAI